MDENQQKDLLYDKRDENFRPLRSNTYFFEMLKKKKLRCNVPIPHTILYEQGSPQAWFFNSKKDRDHSILKKNIDKLINYEIAKFFILQMGYKNEWKIDNLPGLKDYLKQKSKDQRPCVFVRYMDKKCDVLTARQLMNVLSDQSSNRIQILQQYIPNHSKANEQYYVEYRQDVNSLPVTWKFFKKAYKTIKHVQIEDHNNYDDQSEKGKAPYEVEKIMFKFFDGNLNAQFQNYTNQIVSYIERGYRIKIKKIVTKFIINSLHQIIYTGASHLYVEVPENAPYDVYNMTEFINSSTIYNPIMFWEFQDKYRSMKKCRKNQQYVEKMNIPKGMQTIVEQEREFSSQLYKQMRKEKCEGDFCDYTMMDRNRGPMAMKKNIMDEHKKHFGEKKEDLGNIAINLPHEISNNLLLKTRERAEEIVDILIKNKIFNKKSELTTFPTVDENQKINIEKEFPFVNKKFTADNYENQYKRLKICKSCFIIYSLAAKYFDQDLKKAIKDTMRPQTRQFSAPQFITRDKKFIDTSISKPPITADPSSRKTMKKSQLEAISELPPNRRGSLNTKEEDQISQKSLKSNNQLVPHRHSQSHTQFRTRLLPNTKKDIEINRLTLGFMNYDKLKDMYKEPIHQQSQNEEIQKTNKQKKNIILMQIDKEAIQQKKNINQNQQLLQSLNEAKKNLKRKMQTDSEHRATLHEQYQQELEKKGNPPQLISTQSMYYTHSNYGYMRKIPSYKLSTPLKPLIDDLNYLQIEEMNMSKVQELMGYKNPEGEYEINFIIIDEFTAIPYYFYEGNQTGDVVILCHDFFESMWEYIPIVQQLQETGKRFLLFNFPGQAYTVFKNEVQYNNIYNIEVLDRILFELQFNKKKINIKQDRFKFVGIGYGGFFLQSFCNILCMVHAYRNLPNLDSVLFINSFVEIDNILEDTLMKSLDVFETCPESMQELPYSYVSVLVNSIPLTEDQISQKMEINPISVEGRINMIKSCLNSQSFGDKFERLPLQVLVIHTLKNCFVNIGQSDKLVKYVKEDEGELRSTLHKKNAEQGGNRKNKYINGGHSLLEENVNGLIEIMTEYIMKDQV